MKRSSRANGGEGWTCLSDRFDDGGYTGANMERPAIVRLLAQIEAGKVDVVVVYKLDRLTRSIRDFGRIIDTFESHGVAFVSVSQRFDTTSSMGRLMLHVLLSFAQFEREMTAERTRDKVLAARRKGKWTGGYPPLEYDLAEEGGGLVVNSAEADQVREIFRLYIEKESLIDTIQERHVWPQPVGCCVLRADVVQFGRLFCRVQKLTGLQVVGA
ncbi:MAG: recombinase family protein [Planctomycetes bacterium]|nr:recombinase family protein [Planctomycetota bacterium]